MRKAHLMALGLLLLATVVGAGALPAQARGAERLVQGPPDPKHRVLSGSEWLGGTGVDVFYRNKVECVEGKCHLEDGSVHLSCPFQCVDLAVRLYDKVGYKNFIKSSDTRISAAKELANTSELQKPPNERLNFYPNDGNADRPPAPGDLLVFKASAQNGNFGHVAVVSWVAGDMLEYVQQNVCLEGKPAPRGWGRLYVTLHNGKQFFSITDGGSGGSVAGWVHSDLIKQRLIDQPEMRRAGDIRWNRDDTAVYVYLSPARTRAAALGAWGDQDVALLEFADVLEEAGALSFTTYDLAWQIANQVAKWIRSDRRLNPASGVRSVDFTLKYTGQIIWVRPWGGPANGKWIPFVMEELVYAYAPAGKTPKAEPPE